MKRLLLILALLLPLSAHAAGWRPSGENVPLSATTSSARIQFTLASAINASQVLVYNAALTPVVVNCGTSSVVAAAPATGTNGGVLIPPGTQYEIYKGPAAYCAGILTSSTGTVYFSPGVDDSQ